MISRKRQPPASTSFAPGSGRVTLTQVARSCGVSIGTASQILNRRENVYVSARTKQKVDEAARRLGYIPNVLARSLRVRKTNTIGVIVAVPTSSTSFVETMTRLHDAAERLGYRAHVGYHYNDSAREESLLREMLGLCVEGLILAPAREAYDEDAMLATLTRQRFPLVTLDAGATSPASHDVSLDRDRGGYLQVRHLTETGRRRIVIVVPGVPSGDLSELASSPASHPFGRKRFAGHLRALTEARASAIDASAIVFNPPATAPAMEFLRFGESVGKELLRQHRDFDAIVTHDDHLSLGILRALLASGRRVPDDVALISYDDDFYASMLSVPLSTIHQPRESGERALQLLVDQIDADPVTPAATSRHVVLEPRLVVRESTVKGAAQGNAE